MKGYRRPDGRFGIRNHVLILSTVGCANMMVRKIAAQVPGAVALENSKGLRPGGFWPRNHASLSV